MKLPTLSTALLHLSLLLPAIPALALTLATTSLQTCPPPSSLGCTLTNCTFPLPPQHPASQAAARGETFPAVVRNLLGLVEEYRRGGCLEEGLYASRARHEVSGGEVRELVEFLEGAALGFGPVDASASVVVGQGSPSAGAKAAEEEEEEAKGKPSTLDVLGTVVLSGLFVLLGVAMAAGVAVLGWKGGVEAWRFGRGKWGLWRERRAVERARRERERGGGEVEMDEEVGGRRKNEVEVLAGEMPA